MGVESLVKPVARIGLRAIRRGIESRQGQSSGRGFGFSSLRKRIEAPRPAGRGFGGSTLRRNPPQQQRQSLPGHEVVPFRRGNRGSFQPPPTPRPPQPPRPPQTPLRRALDTSRKINNKLTQINRGLSDFVYPGLNEVSDYLADKAVKFIKEQVRRWRKVREILETSRTTPTTKPQTTIGEKLDRFAASLPPDFLWVEIELFCHAVNVGGRIQYRPGAGWDAIPRPFARYRTIATYYANLSWFFSNQASSPGWGLLFIDETAIFVYQQKSLFPSIAPILALPYFSNPYNWGVDRIRIKKNEGYTDLDPGLLDNLEIIEDVPLPRIRNRFRRTVEEGEDRDVSCDLSPVMVAMRQILATNTSLSTQVTQANLQINANINELKPPIATINSTTQATATTVNTTFSTVASTATKVDDLGIGLTNITGTVNTTATRVSNVANKLDDVGGVVNTIRSKVDDIFELGGRIFNRINETFQKTMERLDAWAKWLRLPLLLDIFSFVLLLHNAAMLSSNLVQTLGEILSTALQIIGLTDPDGAGFNVSEVVGKQADDFMASVIGQDNWTKTKTTWKRLNNIYQAAANVMYSVQSIVDSTRSIVETGAEMTGKIGNALKKAGVIFENAFNWLPENINAATARQTKLNELIEGIQNIDNAASNLSSAVSEVKSIQDTVIELKEQRQKFNAAIQELVTGKAEAEAESKSKSQSPTISSTDLKP